MISEYRFLKVDYTSVVSWMPKTDYLRCNPSFYGQPRYDCVMVNVDGGKVMFARLVFMFTCTFQESVEPLALIQAFDAPTGTRSRKDRELGLYRVRARPRQQSEFIPLQSIIRGALLCQAGDEPDEFLVFDVADTDIFIRMKELRKQGYL